MNALSITGTPETAYRIGSHPDVRLVTPAPSVSPALPVPIQNHTAPGIQALSTTEWGISAVRAPGVWALGVDGSGVVIASVDTGVAWNHPALRTAYRGWNGSSASHDYNWHDTIHAGAAHGGGSCGTDTLEPCDDYGHGTHTVGTMVGADTGEGAFSVAPGARWIGARCMDSGEGSPTTYIECLQWCLAPTPARGGDPDPSRAPQIVNNSWSCTASEGCTDPLILRTAVSALRAAGLLVVNAAGNEGPNCSTIAEPPAIYAEVLSVAAMNSTSTAAPFSSRGPVVADGSNRLKPDIAAPGSGIRSTIPDGTYGNSSGTSMAAPHVSGVAALVLSAAPWHRGDVTWLEAILTGTATPIESPQSCGGTSGRSIPNTVFGHGLVDALSAVTTALTDLDGDARTTSSDQVLLEDYLAENRPALPYPGSGDADRDGTIGPADLLRLILASR